MLAHLPQRLPPPGVLANAFAMHPPLEVVRVSQPRVACDGASDIPGGAALGHPRIYLQIDEHGYVDCGYCDRRFVLIGGAADGRDQATLPDISEGASPDVH